jgi:ribose 5-phosphate isomerase B
MRIALASDHAGFALKDQLATALAAAGHELLDLGTDSTESVDYPRYAEPAARAVADGEADKGVLVCGSGNGVAIVANKVPGIRAVNAHDVAEAEMARRHNDANVVTLSGARLDPPTARAIVATFLQTDFDGGRHARRVDQITAIESAAGATETPV